MVSAMGRQKAGSGNWEVQEGGHPLPRKADQVQELVARDMKKAAIAKELGIGVRSVFRVPNDGKACGQQRACRPASAGYGADAKV
ncbi:hypothetical protein [Methylobacterium durans]|uniref:hypothetical protein n=1 Tax=Methylobacterium durans TaxID=2202825 RepID=UPI0013A5972D|nr:hypothetical protein [Methylobacterium durans]